MKENEVKWKDKQKQEQKQTETPKAKVMTETQLRDHQKNLQEQLTEVQTKLVMLQGAIQMVDLQIKQLDDPGAGDTKPKNGVG